MTKSLLVSGTRSGCGKTSVTLGLLAALARRGVSCAPFKTGPDFIDPGLHRLACGRASHNLDSWMLPDEANRALFARYAHGADLAVIEGAMGLYDGASGVSELGSAAHMARLLGAPVLLVADASGMGRSAAAMARGYLDFGAGLEFVGVVLNRVGGPGHREMLAEAFGQAGIALMGMLGREDSIAVPSRHLGLTTAQDLDAPPDWTARLADWVERGLDVDALLARLPDTPLPAPDAPGQIPGPCTGPGVVPNRVPSLGRQTSGPNLVTRNVPSAVSRGRGPRLGVARDRAFCFLYEENLRLLEAAGAELVFFSPLGDSRLPEGLGGLYLPGGYPELHAGVLAANAAMLAGVRAFCLSERPVLAECGGFMYLMEGFTAQDGARHAMAGVFPCRAAMGTRFFALGYREAAFALPTPLGPEGTTARGHEFHYSSLEAIPGLPAAFALSGRKGPLAQPEGFLAGNTLGTYVHLHFASNPALAANFVAAMGRAAQ